MTNPLYTIAAMSRQDVDIAIEWAAAEGWNPGLHDAACYYTADPGGFLIGRLDGEPVATISTVKYGDAFGFLGFYIVRPDYRGRGFGIQIWNAGLHYLRGCTIGLDGVVDQQENYTKSGFNPAYRNIRYEGRGGGTPPDQDAIVNLSTLPFTMIDSFDQPFFPAARPHFTRAWITQPDSHALGAVKNGNLIGYGVLRPCRSGYKIGPLFADNPGLAESLFLTLKSKAVPDSPVYLDTPEVNPAAVQMAERHGMKPMFETARMYRGKQPDLPLKQIFGVTSFEIG